MNTLSPAQRELLAAVEWAPAVTSDHSLPGGEVVVSPKNRTLRVLLRRGLVRYNPASWVVTPSVNQARIYETLKV